MRQVEWVFAAIALLGCGDGGTSRVAVDMGAATDASHNDALTSIHLPGPVSVDGGLDVSENGALCQSIADEIVSRVRFVDLGVGPAFVEHNRDGC
jgi:hypothetical protein